MIVRELELDLDAFEGPFDLLLALVLKEELDLRDVDLPQIELVLQNERQQQVERALERVEVELELPDDHEANRTRATGRGRAEQPFSALAAPRAASTASAA